VLEVPFDSCGEVFWRLSYLEAFTILLFRSNKRTKIRNLSNHTILIISEKYAYDAWLEYLIQTNNGEKVEQIYIFYEKNNTPHSFTLPGLGHFSGKRPD